LKIGRVAGITIRVHASFLLLVVLLLPAGAGYTASQAVAELIWILVVFACVVVHELSHCVVASRYGIAVKDILLLPIGGVSEMERMPKEPARELAIAAAGPAASLGLAGAAAAAAWVTGVALWPATVLGGAFLVRLAWLNLLLAGFNLLPALPLDGGRVLRAGLAWRWGRARATRWAATLGRVVAAGLVLFGLRYDFWLVLIGAFVYLGAGAEGAQEETRQRLALKSVAEVMTPSPWVADQGDRLSEASVAEACRRQGALPVSAAGGYAGLIGPQEATRMSPGQTARDVCRVGLPTLAPDQRLDSAYEAMSDAAVTALAVLTPAGQVVGVLAQSQVATVLRPAASRPVWVPDLERLLGPSTGVSSGSKRSEAEDL